MHDGLNGGVLTNWLAILGVISLFYWAWRIIVALRSGRTHHATIQQPQRAIAAASSAPAPTHATSPPPEDIVAIAAAVYAVLGAHRIVHLELAGPSPTWAVEGRLMQQSSHTPR
jgi:hypothetical protein